MTRNPTLAESVEGAIKALREIEPLATKIDLELHRATVRASEAEEAAERHREERIEAENENAHLKGEMIEVRTSVASEVETLRAEKEILATRDREAREELARLQLVTAPVNARKKVPDQEGL